MYIKIELDKNLKNKILLPAIFIAKEKGGIYFLCKNYGLESVTGESLNCFRRLDMTKEGFLAKIARGEMKVVEAKVTVSE